MNREKTNAIVFGAMMLAIFGVLIVIDTYTGSMMNVLLYYFMPLPFVVFGLKHGMKMMLCQCLGAIFISVIFGLPETIFFSISAMLISMILVVGISKKWESGLLFLAVFIVTTLAQLLSVTLLAKVFGYDMMVEVNEIKNMLGITGDIYAYTLPLMVLLMGGLEAFIFTSLCDIILMRLKMQRLPRFSIIKMHLPKWLGVICVVCIICQIVMESDLAIFFGMVALLVLESQGLSFMLFLSIVKRWSRLMPVLFTLMCFAPGLNLFMATIGLFDIFSVKRQKLLYNRANM